MGPLHGTTVLDLSSVGPASRCTRLLADYGSEVVKIGPVPGRGVTGGSAGGPPFFSYSAQRGMRRALIDLKSEGGRAAFKALALRADVVVESFRPGVMDRLGLGYDTLSDGHRALVYCATTGFGPDGRRSTWAAHDLDYLAVGGYLATTGRRGDGSPPVPGATVADAAAGGMQAALAVTTALFECSKTGHGRRLDVSVADGVLWLMSLAVDEYLATGALPGPGHDVLTGRYACYDTYRAGDGRWLAVGAIEHKFFTNLCGALGCPDRAAQQYDDDRQEELRRVLAARFATKPRDQWVEELSGADTCVAPVLEVAEVGEDADFNKRRCIVEAEHPRFGRFRQVGAVLAGMDDLEDPVAVPDTTTTDTESLLLEAGLPEERLSTWRKQGMVA